MFDLKSNNTSIILLFMMLFLSLQTIEVNGQTKLVKKGFNLQETIIPIEYIKDGGPPRDGIPSIDHPKYLLVHEASYLKDSDRVPGVLYNGIRKAYPIKILNHHEIVNDQFNGTDIHIRFNKKNQSAILVSPSENKIKATTLFWFAWVAFFPETEVYQYVRE